MSTIDGTKEPLTFPEALIEMAKRVQWPTEDIRNEVVLTFQTEFDMVPPPPDIAPVYQDSRDLRLSQQDAEIAELKAALAAKDDKAGKGEKK